MATISRTGIAGGSTISPTHITNIIDALDGTSATTTVVASGSFSGSLTGHATSATTATTASYVLNAISSSFATIATSAINATTATTASYVLQAVSSSFATTASYALNAGGGGSSFPFTGSAVISGSLVVTGSLNASSGVTAKIISTPHLIISASTATAGGNLLLDLGDIAKSGGTGRFILPTQVPTAPVEGTIYWDPVGKTLEVWSDALAAWVTIT